MYHFHVGLGDINIERQTSPNDSTSDCGVILHMLAPGLKLYGNTVQNNQKYVWLRKMYLLENVFICIVPRLD